MMTEVDRWGSRALFGALAAVENESNGRSTRGVTFERFPDGATQLDGSVGIQELEELCRLASRRFPTRKGGIEQGFAFWCRVDQTTSGSRSEGFAFFLQQGLLVRGIKHQLPAIVGAAMVGDLLGTIQDAHSRFGSHQSERASHGLGRDGIVIQVETNVD